MGTATYGQRTYEYVPVRYAPFGTSICGTGTVRERTGTFVGRTPFLGTSMSHPEFFGRKGKLQESSDPGKEED